jgi:hypothetical protein
MSPTVPLLRWRVLHLPKHGHTADEYEDSWAADLGSGRFAVADGASECAFASLWARLLTEGFVAAERLPHFPAWLDEPRRRWSAEVMGLDLPWYAEMKREQGAFATLLGLEVRPPSGESPGTWRAEAVGDSCLFRVRKDDALLAFPVEKASDFGNQPRLIGSRGGPDLPPKCVSGALLPWDRLFLMTDALAQWFLRAHEQGRRPWESVAPLLSAARPQEAFAAWIEDLRRRDGMRNDDVTLLSVDQGLDPRRDLP